MVFSSITFIFYFLPITILLYYTVPKKARNGLLLLVSLIFYGFGEPIYITMMILSILIDYTNGLLIEKFRENKMLTRLFLILSIALNLGLLGFFKYGDFFLTNMNAVFGWEIPLLRVALPVGISFFTFQTMSYSIDVYRGNTKAQKNLITFGAYVSMFPQLIAGPIVIYKDVEKQLMNREITESTLREGIERFILGLGKKVLLANSIGLLWEEVRSLPVGDLSFVTAWLGVAAFIFQIYFDFSGYSDMAIGLGKIFGFDFMENFNYPLTSQSITEFWRRWHMSLGSWFREYVYIPLGGNRKGKVKTLRNIAIVWLLTGFWHGAAWNYLLWGGSFAVVLLFEKTFLLELLSKTNSAVRRFYTLTILGLSFAVFALEDLSHLFGYLKAMLFQNAFSDSLFPFYTSRYSLLFLLLAVASTPYPYRTYRRLKMKKGSHVIFAALEGVLFILCLAYIVDGAYNPFLYFRF